MSKDKRLNMVRYALALDQASDLRDFVATHGNARQMELTDRINSNTQKLLNLEPDSKEAIKLRWEQAQLLTERMGMMKGEKDEY